MVLFSCWTSQNAALLIMLSVTRTNVLSFVTLPQVNEVRQSIIAVEAAAHYYKYDNTQFVYSEMSAKEEMGLLSIRVGFGSIAPLAGE